jgi:hypothetical protein
MSKEIVWHKGPPPHVGWWCSSMGIDVTYWRWFGDDGKFSISVPSDDNRWNLDFKALQLKSHPKINGIYWCDYWPENARVPRVDPRKAESERAMQKLADFNQEFGL